MTRDGHRRVSGVAARARRRALLRHGLPGRLAENESSGVPWNTNLLMNEQGLSQPDRDALVSDPRHLAFSLGQAGPHDSGTQGLGTVHHGWVGQHLPVEATLREPVADLDLYRHLQEAKALLEALS